jgi:hypothetical protein
LPGSRQGEAEGYVPTAFDRRNVPTIEHRPRAFDRRDVLVIALLAVAGGAVGLFLHYANSLPPDQGFIATLTTFVLGCAILVAALSGLLHWAGGRKQTLVSTGAFVAGIVAGYPFGPAVASPVTVAGTASLTLTGVSGAFEGAAACDWAAARARVAQVRMAGVPYAGGEATVTVDLYGVRTTVQAPRALYRWTGPDAVAPLEPGAEAISADGATGSIRVYVIRADVPDDGTEEEPVELNGSLVWRCEAAPPG